jgi:hypothetical protein
MRPSQAAAPFCTEQPSFCGVCQNTAVWLGYAPLDRWLVPCGPTMWLCETTQCHRKAREVYHADRIAARLAEEGREMSDMLGAALAFARHGHPVFPVTWPVPENGRLKLLDHGLACCPDGPPQRG